MARFLPVLLSVLLAAPASAQLHPSDSVAVMQTVQRYHDALVSGDTTTLEGILIESAVIIQRGEARPLQGETLEGQVNPRPSPD